MSLDINQIKDVNNKLNKITELVSRAQYHISTRDNADECMNVLDQVKLTLCEIDEIITS